MAAPVSPSSAPLTLWGLFRAHAYWRLALWTWLGVLLHIGMDYLTSYGTQVFWPFAAGHYTADALFIIDYFYTGLMVVALLLIRMVRQQRQRQYGLCSLVGIGVGSALWVQCPHGFSRVRGGSSRAAPASWWRSSWCAWCAVSPSSRYRLVSLLGIGVGLGIVLWRMTSALARSPALQILALQSGGVHVAFFAGVLGLGAWYGRRWHGGGPTMVLGRCGRRGSGGVYRPVSASARRSRSTCSPAPLGPQMATVERLTALPLPGWGPVQWRGIAVTPSSYLVSRVTLVPPTVTPPDVIAQGPDTSLVRALRTSRLVRLFLDRARFPVVEASERDAEQLRPLC